MGDDLPTMQEVEAGVAVAKYLDEPDLHDLSDAELDRLCAVEVMGWERKPFAGRDYWWADHGQDPVHPVDGWNCWSPTTSGDDCWEVLDECGWAWSLAFEQPGYAAGILQSADDDHFLAVQSADTPGRAVVLATLMAVRADKEGR